jgi:hypothetical protein
MASYRELIGNLKQGNSTAHIGKSGSLIVDAATRKIYVHDGVTPGGTEIAGSRLSGAIGDDGADGGNVIVDGGNSYGSAGAGGNVYIDGGSVLGNDDTDQGGSIVLTGGGSSAGRGGDILIAGGDPGGLIFLYSLPTDDPNAASAIWNDAGTLKISGSGGGGSGSGLDITLDITSAGTDRATATPLSYGYNGVTSGGNNNGVLLPAAVAGSVVIIVFAQSGSDPLDIYAQEGETIMGIDDDAQLVNDALQSTIGIFLCGVDGDWFTNLTMD